MFNNFNLHRVSTLEWLMILFQIPLDKWTWPMFRVHQAMITSKQSLTKTNSARWREVTITHKKIWEVSGPRSTTARKENSPICLENPTRQPNWQDFKKSTKPLWMKLQENLATNQRLLRKQLTLVLSRLWIKFKQTNLRQKTRRTLTNWSRSLSVLCKSVILQEKHSVRMRKSSMQEWSNKLPLTVKISACSQ